MHKKVDESFDESQTEFRENELHNCEYFESQHF